MRLLNLGMPKSGTTTLQTALERAGLRSAHWYDRRSKRFVGRSIYRNYFAGRDPLADFVGFDAITQADYVNETFSYWPQMDHALLGEIRRHHPDCVFVLVTRDVSQIVSSFYRWNDLIDRLATTGAPGLPIPRISFKSTLRIQKCAPRLKTPWGFTCRGGERRT